MATQTTVLLIDDLDGSTADETMTLGLDGTLYEVDLSTKNANKIRTLLSTYVDHARRVRPERKRRPVVAVRPTRQPEPEPDPDATAPKRRRVGTPKGRTEQLKAIREWGRRKGFAVNDRGRPSPALLAAYDAHAGRPGRT